MKTPNAKVVFLSLIGIGTYLLLHRFLDPNIESRTAANQRYWLVAGLLIAGGYVIFKSRGDDLQHDKARHSSADAARRFRNLGVLGWVFTLAGVIMLVRSIWVLRMP